MNDDEQPPELPQDPPSEKVEMPQAKPIQPVPVVNAPAPAASNDQFGKLEGGKGPFALLEAVLKTPKRLYTEILDGDRKAITGGMLILTLACLVIYGIISGCFSMGSQLWAAPVKIALGTLVSAFICLPSLYIFACLGQVEVRFSELAAFLLAMLALIAIMLLGLAPVLFVFTVSTHSIVFMGIMHILFWGIAVIFGLRFLTSMFRFLRGSSFGYLGLWAFIFILVALQMSTTLRPIIGESDTFLTKEKKFFIVHWTDQITGKNKANELEYLRD